MECKKVREDRGHWQIKKKIVLYRYIIKRKKRIALDNMARTKYELPIANVVMGIGLETGADYWWNRTKESPVATVESDTEASLNQREEEHRDMTPEEQKAADEAAIKSLYGKYKRRASDESLSPDDRDKWSEAALDLEFRNPDLFND